MTSTVEAETSEYQVLNPIQPEWNPPIVSLIVAGLV